MKPADCRCPGVKVRARRQVGQAIVEFALVLPWFLLLTIGFLQVAIWGFGVVAAQIAAREAAGAAAGSYLAQYTGRGSWEQTMDDGEAWGLAYLAGLDRGWEVLNWLPLTRAGEVASWIDLELEEDGSPGEEGTRQVRASVSVFLPRIVGLPRPSVLAPYTAYATTRPTRFYSY